MAEHEPSIGATSEWFTPPEYFEAPNLALSRRKESLGSASLFNDLSRATEQANRVCLFFVYYRLTQ
jgi:hypothetical protein